MPVESECESIPADRGLIDQWTMRWAGATCATVAPQLTARVAPKQYTTYYVVLLGGRGRQSASWSGNQTLSHFMVE